MVYENMRYNIVLLEGWPAAGKASVWSLLDGVETVFVEPLHVYVLYALEKLNFQVGVPCQFTVREIRQALGVTEYYKTEQYSYAGSFPLSFGSGMQENLSFQFNWRVFDERFITSVTERPIYAHEFFEYYIDAYLQSYLDGYYYGKISTFVTMTNYFKYNLLDSFRDHIPIKVVQVQRDFRNVIASRSSRKPRKEDGNNIRDFAPSFEDLIRRGEVESILSFDRFFRVEFNDVFVVNLEELIKTKPEIMKRLATYLEIEYSDIFLTETRDNRAISDRYSLTEKINDNPRYRFYQRFQLKVHEVLWRIHHAPLNVLSLRSILFYFALRIKDKFINQT